jgi:hypothetical protein
VVRVTECVLCGGVTGRTLDECVIERDEHCRGGFETTKESNQALRLKKYIVMQKP